MSDTPDPQTDPEPAPPSSRRRRLLNWLAGLGIASFLAALLTPLKDLALVAEAVGTGGDEPSKLPGQLLVVAHAHERDPGHVHEAGSSVQADHLTPPDAVLAYRTGKAGGEMVYLHGAAAVYATDSGGEPGGGASVNPRPR